MGCQFPSTSRMLLQLAQIDSQLIGSIVNAGAIGVCLVALGFYYAKKDKKYDTRIDDQLKASDAFRQEQCKAHEKYQGELKEVLEKYRTALDRFGTTLDSVIGVLRSKGGHL